MFKCSLKICIYVFKQNENWKMKGLLSLLNQKKPLTVLFVCQYKRLTQTSEILDSEGGRGGGSRNVTGGDFYPWIIVENWFRFSSSHWTMLRTITRYSIHKLDILGQTNFNYFVKKITFLRIFRFGRFCSVFKVLQLSSWFWFWFDFDLDTCFKWLL